MDVLLCPDWARGIRLAEDQLDWTPVSVAMSVYRTDTGSFCRVLHPADIGAGLAPSVVYMTADWLDDGDRRALVQAYRMAGAEVRVVAPSPSTERRP